MMAIEANMDQHFIKHQWFTSPNTPGGFTQSQSAYTTYFGKLWHNPFKLFSTSSSATSPGQVFRPQPGCSPTILDSKSCTQFFHISLPHNTQAQRCEQMLHKEAGLAILQWDFHNTEKRLLVETCWQVRKKRFILHQISMNITIATDHSSLPRFDVHVVAQRGLGKGSIG